MKGHDRLLVAIVAGALLIVAGATATTVLHRSDPGYRSEDTPEGATFNYLLALQRGEYRRAYEYISPLLVDYPTTFDAFIQNLPSAPGGSGQERYASYAVDQAHYSADLATVLVRETTFQAGGLFDSGERVDTFVVTLRSEGGAWRIVNSERYWSWQWKR